jgi:ribonuclease HIII
LKGDEFFDAGEFEFIVNVLHGSIISRERAYSKRALGPFLYDKILIMRKVLPCYRFSPDPQTLTKMRDFYEPFREPSPSASIALFAKGEGVVVSIYKPNAKGAVTALFQGINAIPEASLWDSQAANQSVQPRIVKKIRLGGPKTYENRYPQIGSDEVGTGDLFGPICVCSAYVAKDQLALIDQLGVTDSKQMEDDYILSIGPQLIHEFDYSQLSLPNEKYNEVHDAMNMNVIKAKMHNRCDLNLLAKHPGAFLYQDQFAEPGLYYSYLKDEPEVARGICFHTKGESMFPSVALGSVIARYSFLHKMKELSDQYGMTFPFGAGEPTDVFLKVFLAKYGKKDLRKVAKLNFANFKKVI